jgi:hypothetical protein
LVAPYTGWQHFAHFFFAAGFLAFAAGFLAAGFFVAFFAAAIFSPPVIYIVYHFCSFVNKNIAFRRIFFRGARRAFTWYNP